MPNNGCTEQFEDDEGISTNGQSEGFDAPPYAVRACPLRCASRVRLRSSALHAGRERAATTDSVFLRSAGVRLAFGESLRGTCSPLTFSLTFSPALQVYPMSG